MSGSSSSHDDDSRSSKIINYEIDTAEAAQEILQRSSCDSTGVLCLQNYSLAPPAVIAIGDAFYSMSTLRNVILDNIFNGRPVENIPRAMISMLLGLTRSKCNIEYLDVSNNPLGFKGILGLLGLLKSVRCSGLSSLRIEGIDLDYICAKELAKVLELQRKRQQRKNTRFALTSFKVGYNCIKDVGIAALSKVFCQMGTLEEICVQENYITSYGVSQLVRSFSENTNLKVLSLSKNHLMYAGAKCLSDALHFLPNLRELDLSDCALGSRGGCALANVLNNLTNLRILDLSLNDLNLVAGEAIIKTLSSCPGISLDLNKNKFGPRGVCALQSMAEAKSIGLQSLGNDRGECKRPAILGEDYDKLYRKCKRPRLE